VADYEFKCPACDNITVVSMPIGSVVTVPVCWKHPDTIMRRIFSASAVIFKGSGWASKAR
jgi:predicted nucleic acid-binding Zn ribbon protein